MGADMYHMEQMLARESLKEYREIARRAAILYEDIGPQIKNIELQDYENYVLLGSLLNKLNRSEQ